ncbi:MAG: IS256 family transposase [Phototrophicaceae bacterium]
MSSPLKIVPRPTSIALKHYFHQHDISLPQEFWDDALTLLAQVIMEIEVSQLIEASRYERKGARRAYRNGYRDSAWLVNDRLIPLRIPKLRSGTYYPSFLDAPFAEKILSELILKSYLESTNFEQITHTLNLLNISAHKSQIANLEEALYDLIQQYQDRDIDSHDIHLDIVPVDDKGRDRYLALAFDENELFQHEITSEADDEFWQDFVRRLDGRAVHGVEYVAVSRVHTVVRYTQNSSPNMALVA